MQGETLAVGSFSGAAFSTDGGDSWADVTEGLVDDGVEAVAIGPEGHLYVATRYQVQRSVDPLGEVGTSIADRDIEIPAESSLSIPYPNPFKDVTTISFVVARTGPVEVAVYDELGRRLEVLVSRDMPAGRYEAKWRPARTSSGTYFVRMEVGSQAVVEAVTLAK